MIKELIDLNIKLTTNNLFNLKTKFTYDSNKKNILFIVKDQLDCYSHQWSFFGDIMNILQKTHNIFILSLIVLNTQRDNCILLNGKRLNYLNKNLFQRKIQNEKNADYNNQILLKEFEIAFNEIFSENFKLHKIVLGFHEYMTLNFIEYVPKDDLELINKKNQFHDYINDDENVIFRINKYIKNATETFNERGRSVLAFTQTRSNIALNLIVWLYKKYNSDILYTFTVEPTIFWQFFKYHGLNVKNYYYATDKRGTRNFDYFPLAHFQHIFTEHKYLKFPTDTSKKYDLFLAGSLLYDFGPRSNTNFYMNYLEPMEKLDPEKNSIWAPLKINCNFVKEKHLKIKKERNSEIILRKTEKFKKDFVEYLKSHILYKGYFSTDKLTEKIINYKYGIIFRCFSINDSLNPRPVHYAHIGVLPFFDEGYDPEYLSIPKHIQDKLLVRDGNDVLNKIEYFNEHNEERLQLIDELRIIFKTETFMETWQTEILKYFEE